MSPSTTAPVAPARLTTAMRRHVGAAPALHAHGDTVTWRELRDRVDTRKRELALADRSLVALAGPNSLEYVITYLALLDGGHVPMLAASPSHLDRLVEQWQPAVAIVVDGDSVQVDRLRPHSAWLHPDLAVLLGTSGSTGSPKLVRLSHRNIESNASSIASYLGLGDTDVGITSLPLHYCYGLSVLHSHLVAGASVVVTDGSVIDDCFTEVMDRHGVTNLAGVPHTFEMLERSGPDRVGVPSLRLLTQAGGRLAPADVRRWIGRAAGWGVDFVVMYGQTEATARMAYLPPHLARDHPGAIGVPIPGGHLRVEPIDGMAHQDDVGELVYSGPNVMMGYADGIDDLASGAELDELRTGDLARFDREAGVFEIVGRRSRFVKPFGLRLDLDEVEARLGESAEAVAVAGDDDGIVVMAPGADAVKLREAALAVTTLPATRIAVVVDGTLPRTRSGKVDYAAVGAMADDTHVDTRPGVEPADAAAVEASVAGVFSSVLGVAEVPPGSSFVDLGGDSLSYVECSIRLEQALGRVPADWHLRSAASLAAATSAHRSRRLARVDTTVVLRAVGICLVVATHMRLRHVPGGAHLMLGVVGYNVARFLSPIEPPVERLRAGARTIARVAIPTMAWVVVGALVFGSYSLGTFLLVNNYVGPRSHADDHWHFWFIEIFVHLVLAATVLMSIPVIRRLERRVPYGFALGLLAVAYALQLDWADMGDWYNMRYRTHAVAIFFVLGWLVYRSTTIAQRLATTLLCGVVVSGYFRNDTREAIIAGGLILLLWLPSVPWPRIGVRVLGALAGASMWIYITHFTFWPLFDGTLDLRRDVAYVATLAVGVVVWAVAERVEPLVVAGARRGLARARSVSRSGAGRQAALAG